MTNPRPSINRKVLYKNADNFAVWVSIDKNPDTGAQSVKRSLLNAEIQSICNDHISTLDDTLHKKMPRPTPTPRIFFEQGNELSQILWLTWDA